MNKYLVTGASGFVGPHLIKHLSSKGDEVYGLFRKKFTDKESRRTGIDSGHAIRGDILSHSKMNNILNHHQFDGVFHLAAKTHILHVSITPKKHSAQT